MKIKLFALPALLIFCFLFSSYKNTSGITFKLIPSDSSGKDESKNKALKIFVISDLNSSYGSTTYSEDVKAVITQIGVVKPDIILCAGDMVAGQKASLSENDINAMWAGFKATVFDPVSSLKIPFGFTVGNHDASPTYFKDRASAKKFWMENSKGTGLNFVDSAHYPFYYSYIKNNVFFMSWDAAGANVNPEVFEWMKVQLGSKKALNSRLRILTGHLPLYAIVDSKNKPGEVNSDPEGALSFFKAYGLDLYISGHQHAFYPAAKDGVRFLNAGCIGDGPRRLIGSNIEPIKSYTIIKVPVRKGKNFSYKTFTPLSNERIELKSLPDSVTGFNGISRLEKK